MKNEFQTKKRGWTWILRGKKRVSAWLCLYCFFKKNFNVYVLILAIYFNKFTLCLLNNIIDLLKAIKFFIYLKSEINLTSLIIKFTNNKLKPKQHLITNPHKTQKKNNNNNNKIILKSILTSLSEYPHTSDNTQNAQSKQILYILKKCYKIFWV